MGAGLRKREYSSRSAPRTKTQHAGHAIAAGPAAGGFVLSTSETTQTQVKRSFQRRYEDGEIIFDEGDEGIDLYVVQSGHVQISRSGAGGRRVVAKLGPGEFFGEMSVVLGESRSARAIAVGTTELLEIDGETLEGMCLERPEIAIRLIKRLASRLIAAERRLAAVGLDELVGPLVHWLASQSGDLSAGELRIATTLRELAENSAMSMRETHQALHQLMDQKLVRLDGDELVAPDRAALTAALARLAPTG